MATGVLVLCIGQATKLVQYLTSDEKVYQVEFKLGIKTDTGDITGNVLETCSINVKMDSTMLKSFIGKQKQVPPMYSAIKKDGKKLYEYARAGIEVEREARDIEIFDISDLKFNEDLISFVVCCSKGTYIRTLCEDIAEKFGTVGTMTNLRRLRCGIFDISNAIEINEISADKVISMEKLFDNKIDVKENIKMLLNGMSIYCDLPDGLYNLYSDEYIGIGKVQDKYLKREIIL